MRADTTSDGKPQYEDCQSSCNRRACDAATSALKVINQEEWKTHDGEFQ
jgi:hypothetical protein